MTRIIKVKLTNSLKKLKYILVINDLKNETIDKSFFLKDT